MPAPIPATKRAAILAEVRAGAKGRNQIARDHGVSVGSVTKIAKDADLPEAFDRSLTKNATKAAVADNRAIRAATARRLLLKANDLLDQMDQPYTVFNIGGKDNTYAEHKMNRPPTADLRNLMVTAATALDKHLALDRHDTSDPGEMASLLGTLLGGLQAKHGDGS